MAERVETRQEKRERKEREREREQQEKERERQEKEKQERERKERERQERERKKKEEKEMKRRGRNSSSASDISSSPHQPSPTTDNDKPVPPGSQWAVPGGGTTSPTGIGRSRPVKFVHELMIKQPHDSHPVTDNIQPSTTTSTATAAGTISDRTVIRDDEREKMQNIKKSPLVPMKTSPSSTDNTLMTEYNDEPTHTGATNITISPHVDQSMMMTGNYDRLEPSHTDMVPSGSVTTRPVTGPIQGHHLHPSHDDTASPQSLPDINSINTRLAIAEVQRDEYKKEMEKRERELKQRQEEIVQLKVEMRKLQSNSPQTHPQPSHLINERMREELEQKMREELAAKEQKMWEELAAKEQKMWEELAAKEREIDELRRETETLAREKEDLKREKDEVTAEAADNLAAKEKEMREKLTAKEEEVTNLNQELADKVEELKTLLSLNEKIKLLEVDNQQLKMQLDVVTADISLKKAEQNQNEKKEAELMSELEKVNEEKETEINRRDARIKHLQWHLNKLNDETIPTLQRELENEKEKQVNLVKENKDLKRENDKIAIQTADRVVVREQEMEELKKRLEEMEEERDETEAKLRETIDNLQHQLNEAIKVPPVEDGASANSSLTDEEKSKIILEMKEKEIKELTEKIAILERERGNDDHAAVMAQLAEADRERQEMENEREELKRQISISDRLVAENEELKGRLLAYERDRQDSHQQGHESLSSQQKGNLAAQIAKYKMKECQLQDELRKKEKHNMELNEKLSKRNDIIIELSDKLTKINDENKRLCMSMVVNDGVKREVTDAYNEIQRLTHQIYGLNEEIETIKQEHVNEKERLLTTINDQSNTIKQHEAIGDEMVGKLSQQHMLVEEKEQTIGKMNCQHREKEELITRLMIEVEEKNNTIDEFRQQVAKVQVQLQEYADGFNSERKDRTRMGSELNEKRSEVLALQQSLHDETHKTKELEAKYHSLQQVVQQQKNKLSVKDEAAKDWEEEKHMLTTQVNSYARQGDELKKSLTEQTDKCKTLENQLMRKTKIESELQRAVKMELADKQQLEQFIALERARLENKITRVNDTNKTLMEDIEKQRADNTIIEQQLQEKTSEYDRLREDHDSLTKLYQTWKVDRDEIHMTSEELGSGAWAVVKVAYFRGTRVAAKCLHKMIISDFNKSVFIREINIAATIRHPNLVQFIGATLVGSPIILSELMPTSLRKELDRGRLAQPQIIKISSDICCGLNYLHLFQPSAIVHRDVSDANVLLEPSGRAGEWKAKLSDYGSANLIQKISTTSVMPGAFSYAAPEAKFPENHSPAMDVYSFGILVMVMILHMPPSTTVGERETQSSTIKWPPMRSLVQKCINRDHQRRPSIGDVHQLITSL